MPSSRSLSGTVPRVQIFGRRDSRQTQKALRFFKERRVEMSFVDLALRSPAPTELRRFSERLGARALLDEEGRRFRELGLGYLRLDDTELLERLTADSRLLRLPLVRCGIAFAVGDDEVGWRRCLDAPGP